ncbi:hypothetical protein ABID22_001132 [Pontibacter aydingkolensis]|uniref:Nuclear transport factor 2 family protein n=1 Tax=Pontibacter aydingkolensis TaxID=1911536 RepID=A0ABS7CTE0_9BACT|nr:hypothetical protein [Pontibacter aydingkolensis]MBW7467040.1 hypothetical protein [Pontibacter aydingkolensis]
MQELDILTQELYSCVCFKKGENPELEKFYTLFHSTGKLINNSGSEPKEFTVEQFIQEVKQKIADGKIEAFQEKEVANKTDVFSKVAQRFSTYEARIDENSSHPVIVGVNCIQFIQANGKWLITSMVWDDESGK